MYIHIYTVSGNKVPLYYYSRLRIAPAIAEDCYILAVFYLFLFPTTDFSTPLGRFSQHFATRRGVS